MCYQYYLLQIIGEMKIWLLTSIGSIKILIKIVKNKKVMTIEWAVL